MVVSAPAPMAAAAPAMAPVPVAPGMVQPYGGFWIRFLAYLIDKVVLGAAATPIVFVVVAMGAAGVSSAAQGSDEAQQMAAIGMILGMYAILFPILIVLGWLYEALCTSSSWQATLGKKALGLRVTDLNGNRIGFGRATGRFFGKWLSEMILYIGYFMVGFTDKKQGLHDMIAGTLVMKQ